MKIYSKITNELLHIVHVPSRQPRLDIGPEDQFLQVAELNLSKGKTFRTHQHYDKKRETERTQESWVILRGKVKAFLYDIDFTLLETAILIAGDLSITFKGGHNYEVLEDNTLVYEFKTGPYTGIDKIFNEDT